MLTLQMNCANNIQLCWGKKHNNNIFHPELGKHIYYWRHLSAEHRHLTWRRGGGEGIVMRFHSPCCCPLMKPLRFLITRGLVDMHDSRSTRRFTDWIFFFTLKSKITSSKDHWDLCIAQARSNLINITFNYTYECPVGHYSQFSDNKLIQAIINRRHRTHE